MRTNSETAAVCCARFYEQDWVQSILGDSFHPGGVQLSMRLIASLGLPPDARVLDVACGVGTTTLIMARRFGLDAVGVDVSEMNLAKARDRAAEHPSVLTEFVHGSADTLPFPDATFDALVCECAVSTFADQPRAVAEFARVLKPGGVVGFSDMIVEGQLPVNVAGLLAPWTCLSGARSVNEVQSLFLNAGLCEIDRTDESESLRELIVELKQKLLGAALARTIGTVLGLEHMDVKGFRELLRQASELIHAGTVRYSRFTFAKGQPRYQRTSVVPELSESCCDPTTGCCSAAVSSG